MLNYKRIASFVVGATVVVGAAACSDSGPETAPSQARISIEGVISARSAALDWFASAAGVTAAISPDTVQSLEITVAEVAYLPVDGTEADESAWQTLTLDAPVTLDLMSLPTEQAGSIVIAAGDVPVGSYHKVRLLVGTGEIVFKGPLNLGGATDFESGTPYPVTIPSGDQTGLKTDVSFDVTAGEDGTTNAAYLLFDPATTFQNVTATGNGGVILSPVLKAR